MQRGSYHIDVTDSQSKALLDAGRLHKIAADVLSHENVASAEISVALIDGETMRELNNRHLGHDYDTDVLSFLLDCEGPSEPSSNGPRGAGKTLDGEVLVSTDVATRAAVDFGWSVESEVILYLVHGLLHLVGYDDLTDDEKAIMRERERYHLSRWNLRPVYAESSELEGSDAFPAVDPTAPSFGVRG
ncbi:MAG: rRNA maturation RNase YbeY [Planctomycetota bacterium]|nr:rRNA maturation RNase YbeY [Planctomycetaceae bacterium]MDQ3332831.1 rRNA maturation RNase YbeY [Planctomycetota bacterium]